MATTEKRGVFGNSQQTYYLQDGRAWIIAGLPDEIEPPVEIPIGQVPHDATEMDLDLRLLLLDDMRRIESQFGVKILAD